MGLYRYSGWDGRQDFPDLDKDRLLSELESNLTAFGDLATALWKMQREGIEAGEGRHIAGNRELYRELEQKKATFLTATILHPRRVHYGASLRKSPKMRSWLTCPRMLNVRLRR